ncbi:MAG: hypothetical protein AABX89_01150 [Candidatus Thermoplasmatota archaeon]
MGEEFEDGDDDAEEMFNSDTDDTATTLRPGVKRKICPKDNLSLEYRVEGRFVVRFCKKCGYQEED